ncbi:hypothetical protein [Nocardioides lianchengensis]|uniref:Mce-associated membrane protein n=1 Tax=Nocardioides lianchengensis TaxID=1045774 RepID=A0A1G6RGF5_9ACTN|nr:hypothetical protein [Nocardioides lianchengensis]NYG10250.1 Mce-associated membrane protein [Nocardioides lianchengensis]SDD03444.1 Mce-associated membrane protein [Nocardioides lianchengensis]
MTDRPRRTTSRTAAARPRRLAGQGGTTTPAAPGPTAADTAVEEFDLDEPDRVEEVPESESDIEPDSVESPAEDSAEPAAPAARPGLFAGSRVTRVLLAAIVALTVVTVAMAVYLGVSDDDPAAAGAPTEAGAIAVPSDRPILLPWADAQRAASAAAEAATSIVSTSWQDYDEQVTKATALMTPSFAEEFSTTKSDVREGVVTDKIEVQARVVAQSVVRANRTEVQALVFLNQYITRDGGDTTYSPYRALVTVVNTDGGWLVSEMETK